MHLKKSIFIASFIGVLAFSQLIFKQEVFELDALVWFAVMILAGSIFGLFLSKAAHLCFFVAILFWLVFGVGFIEFGAVALWLVGAWSLGVFIILKSRVNSSLANIGATESLLLGCAIYLACWGVMLHFPVNYPGVYIILSLLPIFLISGSASLVIRKFEYDIKSAQEWMRAIPLWWWVGGLAVIGWVLRWTSFPSIGFDDHAQHLRIWTELRTLHSYSFDINTNIWSVAPFVVDLLHGGLSLMVGHDARGAMNLSLAIGLFLLAARILGCWKLPAWLQLLLIVLMASTPMLGNLLLSLQTELMLAVLALAGVRLLTDASGVWREQHVLGVFSCVALCAGIKLPGAVLGVTLLIALAIRWLTQRTTPTLALGGVLRPTTLFLLIPLCLVALHSYVLAWKVTGNPVFPLYNSFFLSPFFAAEDFSDTRWVHGFSISSYVRAFFHTSEFFESGDYVAGWQYLLLLPIAILASFRFGVPVGMRIALIPLLGFGLVMFSATQYWRYLFPVMPVAGVVLGALFWGVGRNFRVLMSLLAGVCIVLNMIFFSSVSWVMRTPAAAAFSSEGKSSISQIYAPVAMLTEKVSKIEPRARVLYPVELPFGATLDGTPLYVNWYAPVRENKFRSLKSTEGVGEFLAEERVNFVITSMRDPKVSGSPQAFLREHMAEFGSVIAQEGSFVLYRTQGTPVQYRKVFDLSESIADASSKIQLLLPLFEGGVRASREPRYLARVPTNFAKNMRYRIEFNCPLGDGFFIAQINWDKGDPYYRLVDCSANASFFVEAAPIPAGASSGLIYVTARDTENVDVKSLSIEMN